MGSDDDKRERLDRARLDRLEKTVASLWRMSANHERDLGLLLRHLDRRLSAATDDVRRVEVFPDDNTGGG